MIERIKTQSVQYLKSNWLNVFFSVSAIVILAWFAWATTQAIRESNQQPERPFEFTQAKYEPVEFKVCISDGVFYRPMGWRVNPPPSSDDKHRYDAVKITYSYTWQSYRTVNTRGLVTSPLELEGQPVNSLTTWVYELPTYWEWEALPTPLPANAAAGLWRYTGEATASVNGETTSDHFHINVLLADC